MSGGGVPGVERGELHVPARADTAHDRRHHLAAGILEHAAHGFEDGKIRLGSGESFRAPAARNEAIRPRTGRLCQKVLSEGGLSDSWFARNGDHGTSPV